jgi:hypothetical protein
LRPQLLTVARDKKQKSIEEIKMSKLKIERGASKVNWVLLKTNIEESISADLDLMCQWSENDRRYIVNELLRFALAQSEEFQKFKTERSLKPVRVNTDAKPVASTTMNTPEPAAKINPSPASASARQ